MTLSRRPRIGETLTTPRGDRFTVDHFVGPGDAIVALRYPGGAWSWAIWRFANGELNTWLSHGVA